MDEYDMSSPVADATSSSSHHYPSWVMLDRYTRLNYPSSTLDHFRLSIADAETSEDDPIRVAFRAVPPPGASRLYVHWTPSSPERRRQESSPYRVEPQVVAAHGNAILLQLTLHIDYDTTSSDFYVYTVHSAGRPPSLRRLPACEHTMARDGLPSSALELEAGLRSSGLELEHMLELNGIGLICRGDGEFVVADLMLVPEHDGADGVPLVAQFCVLRSCSPDDTWAVTRPRIRCEKGQAKDLFWWETDAVVPCGDSLCYVDFFRGILFADVLSERPELRYVQLPVSIPSGDPVDRRTGMRGCPHIFRNVCATEGGAVVRFVEVVTTTVFVSGCGSPVSSSFAINLWKLVAATMTWEKESSIKDSELWDMNGYGGLPRVAPEFPVVGMEEPSVVYLVLSNDGDCRGAPGYVVVNDTRMIVVDMLNRTLRSWCKYTEVNDDEDGDMASRNLASKEAFIPCEFSKYLPVPETSRELNLSCTIA
jgi:hypothetical protein